MLNIRLRSKADMKRARPKVRLRAMTGQRTSRARLNVCARHARALVIRLRALGRCSDRETPAQWSSPPR